MPLTGTLTDVSNRETWREGIELRDADTGDLLNIGAQIDEITVTLSDPSGDDTALLQATLTGGSVTILGSGIIASLFTLDQVRAICPGEYKFGCFVTFNAAYGGDTIQVIKCDVSIIRGL